MDKVIQEFIDRVEYQASRTNKSCATCIHKCYEDNKVKCELGLELRKTCQYEMAEYEKIRRVKNLIKEYESENDVIISKEDVSEQYWMYLN